MYSSAKKRPFEMSKKAAKYDTNFRFTKLLFNFYIFPSTLSKKPDKLGATE